MTHKIFFFRIRKGNLNQSNNTMNDVRVVDFQNIRVVRQRMNDDLVFDSIATNNIKELKKHSNEKEMNRVLNDLNMTVEDLVQECINNNTLNRVLSGRISKKASRQGNNDEEMQMKVCNITSSKYGIEIENLSATAYRPTKCGQIMSKSEMKSNNVAMDDCLKSFDGKMSGAMNGWIFAKVVYGNGGHQDNVFHEAEALCSWVEKYKAEHDEIYVILIDTDLATKFERIKQKYAHIKNIWVVNHVDFQKRLMT